MGITLRGFLNDLGQVVQQTKVNQALTIAKGSMPDMERYHRACGRIEGMEEVVKMAREMLGQMEAAAEEEGGLPEMSPAPPKKRAGGKK